MMDTVSSEKVGTGSEFDFSYGLIGSKGKGLLGAVLFFYGTDE
jgi:hypothetical protein